MHRRDCDLEELLYFQESCKSFCENITALSVLLKGHVDEAAGLLKDSISKKNIRKINDIAEGLTHIGRHWENEMDKYAMQTRAEIEEWKRM